MWQAIEAMWPAIAILAYPTIILIALLAWAIQAAAANQSNDER